MGEGDFSKSSQRADCSQIKRGGSRPTWLFSALQKQTNKEIREQILGNWATWSCGAAVEERGNFLPVYLLPGRQLERK